MASALGIAGTRGIAGQEATMHEIVFRFAALWMAVLLCVSLLTVVRARSSLTRVLALDMVTLLLIVPLFLVRRRANEEALG